MGIFKVFFGVTVNAKKKIEEATGSTISIFHIVVGLLALIAAIVAMQWLGISPGIALYGGTVLVCSVAVISPRSVVELFPKRKTIDDTKFGWLRWLLYKLGPSWVVRVRVMGFVIMALLMTAWPLSLLSVIGIGILCFTIAMAMWRWYEVPPLSIAKAFAWFLALLYVPLLGGVMVASLQNGRLITEFTVTKVEMLRIEDGADRSMISGRFDGQRSSEFGRVFMNDDSSLLGKNNFLEYHELAELHRGHKMRGIASGINVPGAKLYQNLLWFWPVEQIEAEKLFEQIARENKAEKTTADAGEPKPVN